MTSPMRSITISIPGVGDVILLRTLDAYRQLPSEFDGFVGLREQIYEYDPATYSRIVSVASGHTVTEHSIFEAGMFALRPHLLDYIDLLAGCEVAALTGDRG